jgi:cytoskeletal protein CcmA (bactofilin family)
MLDLQLQLNILYIITILLILYSLYKKKEHFTISSDTDIKSIYSNDVMLISNLSDIASKLQTGKLTCSGDLTVKKNLICNDNTNIDGTLTTNNLTVNNNLDVSGNITVNEKIYTNNLSITGKTTIGYDSNNNSPYIINDISNTNSLCIFGQGTSSNRKITMLDNVQINGNLDISGTITTTGIIKKTLISGNFIFTNKNTGVFDVSSNSFFTKANADGIIFNYHGLYRITLTITVDSSSKYSDCSKNTKGRLINSIILIPNIISNIDSSINGDNGHNIKLYEKNPIYLQNQPTSLGFEGNSINYNRRNIHGYYVEIKIGENCTFYNAIMTMTFLCCAQKDMLFSPTFLNTNFILNTTAQYSIQCL